MSIRGLVRHLSVALSAATILAAAPTAQTPQTPPTPVGSSTFVILVSGTRIGTESVEIERTNTGWLVSGAGRLQAPIDLTTTKFEAVYSADWQPERLTLESSYKGEPLVITTAFGVTTASTQVRRGESRGSITNLVTPRSVVLPPNFFAAYESLAVRLNGQAPGARIPIHVPGAGESNITVAQVRPVRVSLGDQTVDLSEYAMTLSTGSGAIPVELWVDQRGRLARLYLPTSSLVAIRDDVATVMAREERVKNPGDEDLFIGARGFTLGATLTRPKDAGRRPAVIFVSAPGAQDRDHVSYGIPLFGQMAGTLADAGYLTVRYDPRGTGRSGGRAETARLTEYSDDLIGIVKWLEDRRDVDTKRISIVGYGDGGPIALLAASREKAIAGVVLLAASSANGRELTLEQQRLALTSSSLTEAERTERLALQQRIMTAVLTGKGWEGIPDDVRAQADTMWFKSWLEFDPAATVRRVNQPLLVLQGALDAEVPSGHASRFETLIRAKKGASAEASQVTIVPGLNHLLIPATSGRVDEYLSLQTRTVSPTATAAVIDWLGKAAIKK